jgi:hypothetical protein
MPQDIDEVCARLRELCRPGVLDCAWRTACYRLMCRHLARGDLDGDSEFGFTDDQARAEFRALLAEAPDAPVCPCHAGEKAAALEALTAPA